MVRAVAGVAQECARSVVPWPRGAGGDSAQRDTIGVRRKEQLLRQIQAMRIPWERVMNELRKILPTDVWLIHIEAKGDGTLTFNGFGLSYESVARFMVNLNGSPVFQNADVVIAQKQHIGKLAVINFSVTAQLAPPGKAAALP